VIVDAGERGDRVQEESLGGKRIETNRRMVLVAIRSFVSYSLAYIAGCSPE